MITSNDKLGTIDYRKLNEKQAKLELKRLAKLISAHNVHYYNNDSPKINDSESIW